jgi:hypothetical protein
MTRKWTRDANTSPWRLSLADAFDEMLDRAEVSHANEVEQLRQQVAMAGAIAVYVEQTIADQKRTIESLEMQNTALRGVFSREEELQATILDMEAREKRLVEAAQRLMAWQVKHVKVWHNSAYDNMHEAIVDYIRANNAIPDKASPESDIDQATRTT